MHLAAVVLAGQPVGKLVHRGDDREGQPRQGDSPSARPRAKEVTSSWRLVQASTAASRTHAARRGRRASRGTTAEAPKRVNSRLGSAPARQ